MIASHWNCIAINIYGESCPEVTFLVVFEDHRRNGEQKGAMLDPGGSR